jgi:hypothetical protein
MSRRSVLLFAVIVVLATDCRLFYLYFQSTKVKVTFVQLTSNCGYNCASSDSQPSRSSNSAYGWQMIGDTDEEQTRLRDLATIVAAWSDTAVDNIPTVPTISADDNLLVLSASASRTRFGMSVIFVTASSMNVSAVLRKGKSFKPVSACRLKLWCIFNDGSVTTAYTFDSNYYKERVSLVDCPLSPFASDELWKHRRTLRVYLASTSKSNHSALILKAFVTVPMYILLQPTSNQQTLTVCTSLIHNKVEHLVQWIEFHRLVGFRKFVVYNSIDNDESLSSILNNYVRKYPNLLDVVHWNFSALAVTNFMSKRHFQIEALHDCHIRYGDQSEWLALLDLDEYVVPPPPYETVIDYLNHEFGRCIVGSINMWDQFYCTDNASTYTVAENHTGGLVIERFTLRAPNHVKRGLQKYLYRPRFSQYLSIHHEVVELSKQQLSKSHITLVHYPSLDDMRFIPGCTPSLIVADTDIRDRFAERVRNEVGRLFT